MTQLALTTDDPRLQELFDWAAATARGHVVVAGTQGPMNVSENTPDGTGTSVYADCYRAGYDHRSGYYLRDFAHQALGAHLLGLQSQNAAMAESFVRTAPAHGGWPLWAINFDRMTPLAIDYVGPDRFVREVPAVFELVEVIGMLYRWTADDDLLRHRSFWTAAVTAFVAEHDLQMPNGVAEGTAQGIFDGAASYDERPDSPMREAGDGFAAQYAATRHAAALSRAAGEDAEAADHESRADALLEHYRSTWSRGADPVHPASGWTPAGHPVDAWAREATWFPPMKGLLAGDGRTPAELSRIDRLCREPGTAPTNVEALTYLPDVFLRHGEIDSAYAWMRAIHDRRDDRHVVAAQGVNGTYPELSFTLVGQVVAGLLGIEPDAAARRITLRPHLPSGASRMEVTGVPFADGMLDIAVAADTLSLRNLTPRPVELRVGPRLRGSFRDPHLDAEGALHCVRVVAPGADVAVPLP